jgi:hypothetical protein
MTLRGTASALGLCLLAGCSAVIHIIDPNRAQEMEQYRRQVSSGFTGCEAADNVISNASADEMGTMPSWHVTCKAKTYICIESGALACAPVAQ